MKEIRNLLLVLLAAGFFIGFYIICDYCAEDAQTEYANQISKSLISNNAGNTVEPDQAGADDLGVENLVQDMVKDGYSADLNIALGGDILCQTSMMEKAYDADYESFDFSDFFENIKEIFSESDYGIATLKTTFAGSGNGYTDEVHGYGMERNRSNAPESLAKAISDAGVRLVNLANNHSFDSDYTGLISTIQTLNANNIIAVGAKEHAEDSFSTSLLINDISVGIVGATNDINVSVDNSGKYSVNNLESYNDSKVKVLCEEVARLKSDNEFVIVMVNFGSVDTTTADPQQKDLAEKLAKEGADLIIGTGSRAIKPMDRISVTDNRGHQRSCIVFYGLGALMSSERYNSDTGLDVDLSAVYQIVLSRKGIHDASLAAIKVTPVYIDNNDDSINVIPICKAKDTDMYSSSLSEYDHDRIDEGYEGIIKALTLGTDLSYTYENYSYTINIQ